MIDIKNNRDCCGCSACVQRCPAKCISFIEDVEGFLYPHINQNECIACGICEQVCPVINQKQSKEPFAAYAAKSQNEDIRMSSSSGGIFSILAEATIDQGGIVFGARFNNQWQVIHDYVDNKNDLSFFRGSKYVQSTMGSSFSNAEDFLKQGKKVLFSGTPCQIAGLELFLRKEYSNLITVDFICHGTPSPKVWRKYIDEVLEKTSAEHKEKLFLTNISFRNKQYGWKKYCFTVNMASENGRSYTLRETSSENIFLKGFLADLYLRPSCHFCPSKSLKSGSDITIADFWGIEKIYPEFNDDRGVSLIMVNNSELNFIIDNSNIVYIPVSYKEAIQYNTAIEESAPIHKRKNAFLKEMDQTHSIKTLIEKSIKPSLYYRVKGKLNALVYILRNL